MSKKRIKELYHKGLEYQKQLDAVEMSARFMTSKELGSYYEVKSGATFRLESNNEEFEREVDKLTDAE